MRERRNPYGPYASLASCTHGGWMGGRLSTDRISAARSACVTKVSAAPPGAPTHSLAGAHSCDAVVRADASNVEFNCFLLAMHSSFFRCLIANCAAGIAPVRAVWSLLRRHLTQPRVDISNEGIRVVGLTHDCYAKRSNALVLAKRSNTLDLAGMAMDCAGCVVHSDRRGAALLYSRKFSSSLPVRCNFSPFATRRAYLRCFPECRPCIPWTSGHCASAMQRRSDDSCRACSPRPV
mmetsp:Transcript_11859/g.34916  ORF Transcript_11859/g.34916 Transcript_11859/m.34916 type:complete len:236 (+) Transcript_11859:296-1003(+)